MRSGKGLMLCVILVVFLVQSQYAAAETPLAAGQGAAVNPGVAAGIPAGAAGGGAAVNPGVAAGIPAGVAGGGAAGIPAGVGGGGAAGNPGGMATLGAAGHPAGVAGGGASQNPAAGGYGSKDYPECYQACATNYEKDDYSKAYTTTACTLKCATRAG